MDVGEQALLEALIGPWQILCMKGTQESGPKLPLLLPPFLCSSIICTHKTPLQGRGASCPRWQTCWTALRPWEVDPGHRRPLFFWEAATELSDCLSHPQSILYITVTASQCPDASWRFSPSVALIALKKKKTNHTVSSKVFFDVCSSPSPGAVRSDFGMKAQSLSDLSSFLPASLPPYVYTLPENLREPGRRPSGNTGLERSPGLESALALGSCPGLDPGLSMVCGFRGSGDSLPAFPSAAVTSCSGPHCSSVGARMRLSGDHRPPPRDAYMVLLELMCRDGPIWERKQRPIQMCYPPRHMRPRMGRATQTPTPQQ